MTPQDLTLLIGAIGAFFAVLGGGAKWLLSHIDTKALASAQREESARSALSERLQQEINGLRADIAKVQAEKAIYLQRIYQLEHFIHLQPGINIPTMEGWPPR